MLFALAVTGSLALIPNVMAQDYPYDDDTTESSLANPTPAGNLPRETPGVTAPARPKRQPTLMRFALKAGGDYSIYSCNEEVCPGVGLTPISNNGLGFDVLLALMWDLPYQPISLELQSGYRGLMMNTPTNLNLIPFEFGVFHRTRLGSRSLWKLGMSSSFDLRIASVDGNTLWSVTPSISARSIWEFENILIEPSLTIHRIRPNNMFLTFAMRAGLAF